MRSSKQIAAGCLAMLLGTQTAGQADSIWQRRTDQHGFLFYDTKARYIGDRVTVIISQSTDVANTEQRGMSKETSIDDVFNFESSASGGFKSQAAAAALDFSNSSSREFDGSANYSAAQLFTDRITVTVMDVLPNGDMVISGSRRLNIAGEERTLTLTGVIRAIDIGSDNSVASRYIAEPRISYEAAGPSQKFSRQGWLGRITNRVWPF